MGMSTEKYCTKSTLDISNFQCGNMAQSLQVVLFLRASTQQLLPFSPGCVLLGQ